MVALQLLGGLALLVIGGEVLVRGASSLALSFKLSPLVVGLTVVAFATSAPELAVTLQAVADGSPELAVGNVVGSNIANILLVLGVSALIGALVVRSQLVRIDIPIMIAFSVLFLVFVLDRQIAPWEAGVLFLGLLLYVAAAIVVSRRQSARKIKDDFLHPEPIVGPPDQADDIERPMNVVVAIVLVLLGVGMLVLGANLLVAGATAIAVALGVSEFVIGLTVVAVGTSLPELATSIVAAVRGERDLAVGNAVGSCVFNLGAVLGITGIVAGGIPVPDAAVTFDIPVMILVSVLLLPMAITGLVIGRLEGAVLVLGYLAYTLFLLLKAAEHDALEPASAVFLYVVIPAVALTLVIQAIAEIVRRRSATNAAIRDEPAEAGASSTAGSPTDGGSQ